MRPIERGENGYTNGDIRGNGHRITKEQEQLDRVRTELEVHGEYSTMTVAQMRERSDQLFVLAEQEAVVTNEKRSKSKVLKIASAVELVQDKISHAVVRIPRSDKIIPIGKIVPPVVLGGLIALPFVVPESAHIVTPLTGIVGGLTSGELITKVRDSKIAERFKEWILLQKIKGNENFAQKASRKVLGKSNVSTITSDTLIPYFKQFSEVVDPSDVRDCLRTRHEEGMLNEIIRFVYERTNISPPESMKAQDDLEEWEDRQQEKVVQMAMEAQQKAQLARSGRNARYSDAIDKTVDLGIGLAVVGGPSIFFPAAGLTDDLINVGNAVVTIGSAILGKRLEPADKKPEVNRNLPHGFVHAAESHVGSVGKVAVREKTFNPTDPYRKKNKPPNTSTRQFNQQHRRQ